VAIVAAGGVAAKMTALQCPKCDHPMASWASRRWQSCRRNSAR